MPAVQRLLGSKEETATCTNAGSSSTVNSSGNPMDAATCTVDTASGALVNKATSSQPQGMEVLLPACSWLPTPVTDAAGAGLGQAAAAAAQDALRLLFKQRQAAPDQQLLVALQAAWHGTAQLPINQER
jgi:hypothetical protein